MNEYLIESLRKGVQRDHYGLFHGEYDTTMAEYHMNLAADEIEALQKENLKLRCKLNKRQEFINYLFCNYPKTMQFLKFMWEVEKQ